MHLLQQHILDIQCSSPHVGMAVQKDMSSLMEKEFYPRLEQLLDKYDTDNTIWKIDKLSLDLPSITYIGWKNEFITQSLAQIENYLLSNSREIDVPAAPDEEKINESHIISIQQHAKTLFISYLENGVIPVSALYKNLPEILQTLEINDALISQLTTLFSYSPASLARYIFNIPKEIKNKIEGKIDAYSLSEKKAITPAINEIKTISGETSAQLAELLLWLYYMSERRIASITSSALIFNELSLEYWGITPSIYAELMVALRQLVHPEKIMKGHSTISKPLKDFIETIIPESNLVSVNKEEKSLLADELQQKKQNSEISNGKPKESAASAENVQKGVGNLPVYIQKAGLVILHPFLKTLFERLELWVQNEWATKNSQHKAILLTQYLVTGDTTIGENELVLNKILCGFPVASVVNTKIEISEHDKEQCNELLLAVIANWEILKSTSVAGLREAFLMRAGKLEIKENSAAQLWVEQKGMDVLLAHLPWGISTVKTPWMTDFLHCHWR